MNDQVLEDKYKVVLGWLKYKYGNDIPPWEVTADNIQIMYDLATLNQIRTAQVQAKTQFMLEILQEYKVETDMMRQTIDHLGVKKMLPSITSSDSSTSSLHQVVRSLTASAVELDLKDTETSSFFFAINRLHSDQNDLVDRQRSVDRSHRVMKQKLSQAQTALNSLQKILKETKLNAEKTRDLMKKQKEESPYYDQKQAEYTEELSELQEKLTASGLKREIMHPALVQLRSELDEVQQEDSEIRSKLDVYNDLPPDVALAEIKITEAKRRYNEMEDKLRTAISEFI
ncbi:HAUS augmin-like complex subunit 1-like [Planoprotostelium fungivorum]|uniref:HAUS augmin-like complex subunit 1-like n=1 Tax=Planoprotostelium fungivorum TaxID=1890364 RepID=A0A2P6MXW3_9EUKA|nr:HAUS augmin-like complex subunit 1-like [Planoprotostelium fungivorum]